MRTNSTSGSLLFDGLSAVQLLVLLKTFLQTKVLELALVADRSEEALAAGNVLLAVDADFQPLLVVLEADVGAELLDVGTESDAVLAQAGRSHGRFAGGAGTQLELIIG